METPDYTNKISLQWKAVQFNTLWFDKYDPLDPEVLNSNLKPGHLLVVPSGNYDFELSAENKPRIYIDIILKVIPLAAIMTRICFENENHSYDWDFYFRTEVLEPCVKIAVHECINTFKKKCTANNVNLDRDIPPGPGTVQKITQGLINMYYKHDKENYILNQKVIMTWGFKFIQHVRTQIILKVTFMIMDDVLYFNKNFNRKENLKQFKDCVPEPKYHTVKMKCIEIDHKDVTLSWYHTVFFLNCLDCALQLMLGDHEQKLLASLGPKGITDQNRDLFIREGAKILDDYNDEFKKTGKITIDIEKKYDWNRLIS
jgi:hypothetical protein